MNLVFKGRIFFHKLSVRCNINVPVLKAYSAFWKLLRSKIKRKVGRVLLGKKSQNYFIDANWFIYELQHWKVEAAT